MSSVSSPPATPPVTSVTMSPAPPENNQPCLQEIPCLWGDVGSSLRGHQTWCTPPLSPYCPSYQETHVFSVAMSTLWTIWSTPSMLNQRIQPQRRNLPGPRSREQIIYPQFPLALRRNLKPILSWEWTIPPCKNTAERVNQYPPWDFYEKKRTIFEASLNMFEQ